MRSPCDGCKRSECPEPCWPLKDYKRHLKRVAKVNPCYDCPDRKPGCHGVCPKYIEWTEARAALANMNRNDTKDADAYLIGNQIKAQAAKKRRGEKHL